MRRVGSWALCYSRRRRGLQWRWRVVRWCSDGVQMFGCSGVEVGLGDMDGMVGVLGEVEHNSVHVELT